MCLCVGGRVCMYVCIGVHLFLLPTMELSINTHSTTVEILPAVEFHSWDLLIFFIKMGIYNMCPHPTHLQSDFDILKTWNYCSTIISAKESFERMVLCQKKAKGFCSFNSIFFRNRHERSRRVIFTWVTVI